MITRKSREFKGGIRSERKTPKNSWELFFEKSLKEFHKKIESDCLNNQA